jgi:hypothetical protein
MKLRQAKPEITEDDEHRLVAEIRRLASDASGGGPTGPPDAYWANLIIRTNRRIDEATSGKALSISWAWRVAVPGVVAVVSFLIGLHYYAPVQPQRDDMMIEKAVLSLPEGTLDSLLTHPEQLDPPLTVADIGGDPFEISGDVIADYLISNQRATDLVETMSDTEADQVIAALMANAN